VFAVMYGASISILIVHRSFGRFDLNQGDITLGCFTENEKSH